MLLTLMREPIQEDHPFHLDSGTCHPCGLWMFDHSPDSVELLEKSGRVVYGNRASLAGAHEDAGADWDSRWPATSRGDAAAALRIACSGGVGDFLVRLGAGDRRVQWLSVRLTPVRQDGAVTHVLSVARDVSEWVVGQEGRGPQITAEPQRRGAASLVAEINHQVRTPLNAIVGLSSMLLARDLGDAHRDRVEMIRWASGQLAHVLESLVERVELSATRESTLDFTGTEGASPQEHVAGNGRSADPASLRGRRLLVVEDDFLARLVMRELLEQAGMSVSVACHGQEALALLKDASFDAVLMDMNMPVMGGIEATRRIRADLRLRELPVIALTGNVLEEDRLRCAAAGCSDFLPKPVDASKLWSTLARWMPRR